MPRLTRTWPALFSWGSGLLHLSLGAAITLSDPQPGAVAVASALLVIGSAELVWGALTMRAGRPVAPRTAVVGALVGIVASAASLTAGSSPLSVAASLLLTVAAAATIAVSRRPGRHRSRPWAGTVGAVAGAVIVAALATPALSAVYVPGEGVDVSSGYVNPHAGH